MTTIAAAERSPMLTLSPPLVPRLRMPRGTYLGGQQVAAILGVHPYMSIGHVYERSVYGTDDVDPQRPAIRRGRIVEPGLLEEARTIDEVPADRWHRDVFVRDASVPFFAGTCDALVVGTERPIETIYEVTTCSTRTVHLWGTGVEDCARYKWVQAQWYMGITGAKSARVLCLVTDDDTLLEYTLARDGQAIEQMRDVAEAFWLDHVLERVPPRPDAFGILVDPEGASDVMDRIYRAASDGREVEASPLIVEAAHRYGLAREAVKAAEAERARWAATLKGELGDATLARFDGGRVTWTKNKDSVEVDLDGVITDLAKRAQLSESDLAAVRALHTTSKPGPRVMRVNLPKTSSMTTTNASRDSHGAI
jgi:predicted phage-related endonuclease